MATAPTFTPFSDETLQALEERFERVCLFTPAPRARSAWAKPDAPEPQPAYQVVFRPCNPGEWDSIMGQTNGEKTKPGAPKNLAKATIVAVSFDGALTVFPVEERDHRKGAVEVRTAFDRLLSKWVGVPEAVADHLAELNGVVRDAAEKG